MDKLFEGAVLERLHKAKVLLVGAGGIGCELLKDLILMEIGEINIIDLDTIDLSNLNRQFLFRQKDIKKSKSLVANEACKHFDLFTKVVPHHGNIMEQPLEFFEQFDIIYNALDNLEARLFVNKMAVLTKTPLFESGTTGNKGQVQPIYPNLSECFHCKPKATPKSFPVCTIRSTPSKPIHAITWSKNFLLGQLFGQGDADLIAPAEDEFTNDEEAEAKRKEVNELDNLRESILNSQEGDIDYIIEIMRKIYIEDIERLKSIDALWKTRSPPMPLDDIKTIIDLSTKVEDYLSMKFNSQQILSLKDYCSMMVTSILKLTKRLQTGETIEFDKDDQDTLQFVVSSANIRSYIFGIELKSEFDIKQIAGNIIPAVATTNAIMAGFSALTSMQYFFNDGDQLKAFQQSKMIYDSNSFDHVVNNTVLSEPNPNCKTCSITRGFLKINLTQTVGALRDALISKYGYEDDIEIFCGSKLIYDYDMEDNLELKLDGFFKSGETLMIGDSDETLDIIELYVLGTSKEGELQLPELEVPLKKTTPSKESEEGEEEAKEEDVGTIEMADEFEIIDGPVVETSKRPLEDEVEESLSKKVKQ